jgi:voltage-gated potassium channel
VHPLHKDYLDAFELVDHVLLVIFTVEYLCNIWVAPDRKGYVLGVWGLIDLVSIAPSFLSLLAGSGSTGAILPGVQIGFLRELRTLRVLRMLKLMKPASERASESTATVRDRNTLWLDFQIYLICLITVVIISATLVYHIEPYPPDAPALAEAIRQLGDGTAPSTATWTADPLTLEYKLRAENGWPLPNWTFDNVPMALWWSFVTLTTTRYGDMYPVTGMGLLVGALTMFSGLALFSLLTSVGGRTLMRSLFGRRGDASPQAIRRATAVRVLVNQVRALLPGVGLLAHARAPEMTPAEPLAEFGSSAREIAGEVVRQTSGMASVPVRTEDRSSDLSRLLHAAFVDEGTALNAWVRRIITVLIHASIGVIVLNSVAEIHEA